MSEFQSIRSYEDFERFIRARSSLVTDVVYGKDYDAQDFLATLLESSEKRTVERTSADGVLFRAQRAFVWETYRVQLESGEEIESGEHPAACPFERLIPNPALVGEGRANRKAVPVLYLADTPETAVAEMRPWIGEWITVAEFELTHPCRLIDCSRNTDESIWHEWIEVSEESGRPVEKHQYSSEEKDKAVWGSIGNAFSTPLARDEPSLEYLPTQVIAEAFRAHGYDGLIYQSLLAQGGRNIALFDVGASQPKRRCLYRTRSLSWELTRELWVLQPEEDEQRWPSVIAPQYKVLKKPVENNF